MDPELTDNTYKGPDFEPDPVVVPVEDEHYPDHHWTRCELMLKVEICETILHAISIRIDPVFQFLGSPVRTVWMGKPNIQNWGSSHWEVMLNLLGALP